RGYSAEYEQHMQHYRLTPGRESLVGRIALEGRMVHIPDVLADPEYRQPEQQKLGGWRTMIGVPLLREGTPFGALTLTRSTVRPFTEKQIETAHPLRRPSRDRHRERTLVRRGAGAQSRA